MLQPDAAVGIALGLSSQPAEAGPRAMSYGLDGGWAVLVPNVHRLLRAGPEQATLLTALHSTVLYAAAGSSAALGAAGVVVLGASSLGPLGSCFIVAGLLAAEGAHHTMRRRATDGAARPPAGAVEQATVGSAKEEPAADGATGPATAPRDG